MVMACFYQVAYSGAPMTHTRPLDHCWSSYGTCVTSFLLSPLPPPILSQPQPTSVKGPPDPYVKLYVTPDLRKKSKQRTKVVESTHNPTYNETVSVLHGEIERAFLCTMFTPQGHLCHCLPRDKVDMWCVVDIPCCVYCCYGNQSPLCLVQLEQGHIRIPIYYYNLSVTFV